MQPASFDILLLILFLCAHNMKYIAKRNILKNLIGNRGSQHAFTSLNSLLFHWFPITSIHPHLLPSTLLAFLLLSYAHCDNVYMIFCQQVTSGKGRCESNDETIDVIYIVKNNNNNNAYTYIKALFLLPDSV